MSHQVFDPDKTDFTYHALRLNGNMNQLAKHYNINHDTIYQYIKRDPVGKEIIQRVREWNTECDLDSAEFVIRYNLKNVREKPGIAQRAAEKVLEWKGSSRGWENTNKETNVDPAFADKFEAHMEQLKKYQSDRNIEDSSSSNE